MLKRSNWRASRYGTGFARSTTLLMRLINISPFTLARNWKGDAREELERTGTRLPIFPSSTLADVSREHQMSVEFPETSYFQGSFTKLLYLFHSCSNLLLHSFFFVGTVLQKSFLSSYVCPVDTM